MRILYIGNSDFRSSTRYRADALIRLGHEVKIEDPFLAVASQLKDRILNKLHYCSGYRLLQLSICSWVSTILRENASNPLDLIWVDHGELIGYHASSILRQLGVPLILYNVDDPTGGRDGRRFDSLLKAIPVYDLCAVVRLPNVHEFLSLGAKSAIRVWMGYDEFMHRPFENPQMIPTEFVSDIAFVGTWIRGEGRDRFLLDLIEGGLSVAIWGNRWDKAPLWSKLKAFWRGSAIYGRDYVAAIQGAKISLGLLSHGNRDLHTSRSAEIPYAGGLLCAERTTEHLDMYQEGSEAVFWRDSEECTAVCHRLLVDEGLREKIRLQGARRVRQGGFGNEAVCQKILDLAINK